jgi:enoyl-CoA hydratase
MSAPGDGEDVHVVRIEHGKANAIDSRLVAFLSSELDRAMETGKRAVVLTGKEGFFSAGLNLKELPEDRAGMATFLEAFEALGKKLIEYPLPLVVAVNGHAIAGGCIIASAGDVRVGASGDYRIGVSEVTLGVVFPAFAFEIMRQTLAPRSASEVLLAGKLLTPEEAVEAGILHRVVPPDALLGEATSLARELGSKPEVAFRHSKLALRAPMIARIEQTRDEAGRQFLDSWFSPDVVERRKSMLSR